MILTLLIMFIAGIAALWKIKARADGDDNAFDLPTTHIIKGLCAIVVVMVHIPLFYSNPLQDAIGSFAYVAVTFFFFVSAYGMEYSYYRRPGYLRKFWINRLAALLIPMIMVNMAASAYCIADPDYGSAWYALIRLNGYVKILLEYCIAFYLLHLASEKFRLSRTFVESTLIVLVVISSVWIYFFTDKTDDWPIERIGLIWGLLTYRFREPLLRMLKDRNTLKIACLTAISVAAGITYVTGKAQNLTVDYFLKIFLGISLISLLFAISTRLKPNNAIGRFFGDISYEIYLSHTVVMRFIAYYIPNLDSGCFIFLTFAFTITFAWIVKYISERLVPLVKGLAR